MIKKQNMEYKLIYDGNNNYYYTFDNGQYNMNMNMNNENYNRIIIRLIVSNSISTFSSVLILLFNN